jgi:hypothetical protein
VIHCGTITDEGKEKRVNIDFELVQGDQYIIVFLGDNKFQAAAGFRWTTVTTIVLDSW